MRRDRRTRRKYTRAMQEWRESCFSSELPLTALVVPLSKSGTPGGLADVQEEYSRNDPKGSLSVLAI